MPLHRSSNEPTTLNPTPLASGVADDRCADRRVAAWLSPLPRTTRRVQSPIVRARPSVGISRVLSFQQSSTHSRPPLLMSHGLLPEAVRRVSIVEPHQ